jgi:hypothetical protein
LTDAKAEDALISFIAHRQGMIDKLKESSRTRGLGPGHSGLTSALARRSVHFRTFALRERYFTLDAGGFLGASKDSALWRSRCEHRQRFEARYVHQGLEGSAFGKGRQSTTR